MAIVPVMWQDVRGSRMRVRPTLALAVLWDLVRIPFLHRDVRRAERPADPLSAAPAAATPRGRSSEDV